MDVKKIKSVYMVGLKGVGMTSLALCFQDLSIKVTGSDTEEIFVTDEILKKRKINWHLGFEPQMISKDYDLVVTTGAHGGLSNPQVLAAQKMKIPVMTHAEALGLMAKEKETIATCGVGGKTTTCAMIATILSLAQKHPSFAIGVGNIYPMGVPGRYDNLGQHFICEADEFAVSPGVNNKPRFSFLSPKILVVGNLEHDHPDVYPTLADVLKTFKKFFLKIPRNGLLIACLDNQNIASLIGGLKIPQQTFGFSADSDWKIILQSIKEQTTHFSLVYKAGEKIPLVLQVPGEYNVKNATAAFIVGKNLGLSDEELRQGLASYRGCRRRFEKIGVSKNGIIVYDDYAHHPTEIKSVLKAARLWFPKSRILAIFQPHTYSRTKALFSDFAQAFDQADLVGFMDIYSSAREVKDVTVSSELLAQEAKKYKKQVFYVGDHQKTLAWIKKNAHAKDLILTLGAGDIFQLHQNLLKL